LIKTEQQRKKIQKSEERKGIENNTEQTYEEEIEIRRLTLISR